jgi:hypothetical protein
VAVLLESVPSGASVLTGDGARIGFTPVSWTVTADSERAVTFQKDGFLPITRRFRATSDSTLAVHLDNAADGIDVPPSIPRSAGKPTRRSTPSVKLDSMVGTIDPFSR